MLKVFVPCYDAPTKDNARLAHDVFPHSPSYLVIGAAATRSALHALIAQDSTTALLVLSHGGKDCVLAQDGEVALSVNDICVNVGNVLRLPVFLWACLTSQNIGQVFHNNAQPGAAWWGYRNTISAPDPGRINAFREVLKYISEQFHVVHDEKGALDFLSELRKMCLCHRKSIVMEIGRSRKYGGAYEIASGLKEVWQLLDVMLYGVSQPVIADMIDDPIIKELDF